MVSLLFFDGIHECSAFGKAEKNKHRRRLMKVTYFIQSADCFVTRNSVIIVSWRLCRICVKQARQEILNQFQDGVNCLRPVGVLSSQDIGSRDSSVQSKVLLKQFKSQTL
jgi:hypothetical protein